MLFSDEQKEALRLAFSMDPYPSTATIEFLAAELGLSVRTITNWFHNHRMRLKQHVVSPGPDDNQSRSEPPPPTLLGPPPGSREGSASFDPALFRCLLVQRLADMHGSGGDKSGPSAFGAGSGGNLTLNAYNSYSPSSQQGNDEGTLDLSMSSSQASSGRKTWARGGGTPTEDLDDSNLSQDEPAAAGSDRDSLKEESISTPSPAPPRSAAVGAQHNSYSSRRRKPAAPKWVDPGLSPDSDDAEDDDASANADDDCGVAGGDAESAIINGVCVRQTAAAGDFGLRLRETVRVDPVAAADEARKSAERDEMEEDEEEEEETALELCTTAKKSSSSGDGMRKLEQRLDNRGEERGDDWEF